MPDQEHRVLYTAIADFANLSVEARKARQELKGMNDEEIAADKKRAESATASKVAQVKALEETKNAIKAKSFAEAAAYKESDRLEKGRVKAERDAAAESVRIEKEAASEKSKAAKAFNDALERQRRAREVADRRESRRLASEATKIANEMEKIVSSREKAFERSVTSIDRSLSSIGKAGSGGGGGIFGFFDKLIAKADSFGSKVVGIFARFGMGIIKIVSFVAALGSLITVLGALGGLAIGVASSLGSLVGALGALPGLAFAAVTGVTALVVALAPVFGAFKAFGNVQDQLGEAAVGNASQQRAAARQIRDASRQVADAERNLAKAHEAVQEAQEDLNDARKEALQDLKDLRKEVERGALNEEEAVLALAKAQNDYRKALADPTKGLLDRQQALLDVKDAELDLKDVRDTNAQNSQKLAEAEKKGIEGSDKVIDAKKKVADANEGVQRATEGVQRAIENLAEAQTSAAEGSSSLATAQRKLQAALDKLSPSARTFVEALFGMKDAFDEIQKNTQEALFAPLVGQLGNIKSLLPTVNTLLTDAAGAIGRVTARGIEMLASGPWKADFATLSKANVVIIETLGDAALYVVEAFKDIAVAAIPFTTWIVNSVKELAQRFRDWAKEARANGTLAKFFDDLKERIKIVARIVENLAVAIFNFGKASTDLGDWALKGFEKITKGWADAGKAAAEPNSKFRKFLEDIKPLLQAIGNFIGKVAEGFGKIASDPKNIEITRKLFEKLGNEVLPKVFDLIDKFTKGGTLEALIGLISNFLSLIQQMASSDTGGIRAFIEVISGFFKLIVDLNLGKVLAYAATGLAAFAAVSVIGRFAGLFKLLRGLRWLMKSGPGIGAAIAGLFSGKGIGGFKDLGSTLGGPDVQLKAAAQQLTLAARELMVAAGRLGAAGTVGGTASKAGTAATAGTAAAGTAAAGGVLGTALRALGAIALIGMAVAIIDDLTGGQIQENVVDNNKEIIEADTWKEELELKRDDFGETIGGFLAETGHWFSEAKKWTGEKADDWIGKPVESLFKGIGDWFSGLFEDEKIDAGGPGGGGGGMRLAAQSMHRFNEEQPGFIENFINEAKNAYQWVLNIPVRLRDWAVSVVNDVWQLLVDAYNWVLAIPGRIRDWAIGLANDIWQWLVDAYNWVIGIPGRFIDWAQGVGDGIAQRLNNAWEWIKGIPGRFIDWAQGVGNGIVQRLNNAWEWIKRIPENIINWAKNIGKDIYNNTLGRLPGVPNLAKGGGLPEGLSMVGEQGPEWSIKRGNRVDIVPMDARSATQARAQAQDQGANTVPGFAFGTNFGADVWQNFTVPKDRTSISNNTTNNNTDDHGLKIGQLTIVNPVPEKSGDSLYRTSQKMRFLAGRR